MDNGKLKVKNVFTLKNGMKILTDEYKKGLCHCLNYFSFLCEKLERAGIYELGDFCKFSENDIFNFQFKSIISGNLEKINENTANIILQFLKYYKISLAGSKAEIKKPKLNK